jgi:hypothetical protein
MIGVTAMKWTLPVLLFLAACGGREVTETTVTTTTTTPVAAPAGGAVAGSGGGAAGAGGGGVELDGTGTTIPAVAAGTTVLAADAAAFACLTDEQRNLRGQPLAQALPVLPANVRILRPETIFERDYRPNRVNADVDGKEIVTRVWCG